MGSRNSQVAKAYEAASDRPELHVDANVGIGVIEVVREGYLRDQFSGDHFDRFGQDRAQDYDGGTLCA